MASGVILSHNMYIHTVFKEKRMARPETKDPQERKPMSGLERLNLRVANMINHPLAQDQMWVRIHRLETDGEREWEEVMGVLSEVDGIDMTFNDEDESVTLRWKPSREDDPQVQAHDEFLMIDTSTPF
ncbi:hypothetical protein ALP50_03525 [Pseudomonas syringae pv. spinaceae]|nr:hypothetical protein ALP50_03525 [Pseudomonas syringae pv. spinaceae]